MLMEVRDKPAGGTPTERSVPMKGRSNLTGGLVVAFGFALWSLLITVSQSGHPSSPDTWTRTHEPVSVTGDRLWLYHGADLDDLFVYAYSGGTWQPIPFQFDEVDASGVYTVEDGLLDANDELVVMAMDLGEEASLDAWISDVESQDYPRYEIRVSDPVHPGEQAWAYVYRSTTLVPGPTSDYVDWDPVGNQIEAATYRLAFSPTVHPAIDMLELNNSGADALDRTKIRIGATCHLPIPLPPVSLTLTEEDLTGQQGFAPTIDGPVRVGSGDDEGSWWFYRALYRTDAAFSLDDLTPPEPCQQIEIHWLRLSNDWLDPTISGMAPMTYYDINTPGGVPVDGNPDGVPQTPFTPWQQMSGNQGSVIQVLDISLGGGSLSNYYLDEQVVDPSDTGQDQQSFGDAGFRVIAPAGQSTLALLTFVLDPDQPNQGATYLGYQVQPLDVEVVAQGGQHTVYLPLVFHSNE
jgi:hypothetical protein